MGLVYKKGNLFEMAPNHAMIAHACNAKGVWGSGIAVEFKRLYPEAFLEYNKWCKSRVEVGKTLVAQAKKHEIVCMITSEDYGPNKDSKDVILVNTVLALEDFCDCYNPIAVYSNMFNSGKFAVPWEETERILKVFVDRYKIDWTVAIHD